MKILAQTFLAVSMLCFLLVPSNASRNHSGLVFIGSASRGLVTVYDSDTLQKLSEIKTAYRPSLMQISRDGRTLYAVSDTAAVVDLIDLSSLLVTSRLFLPVDAGWFSFSSDRRYLLAATTGLQRVYWVDLLSPDPQQSMRVVMRQHTQSAGIIPVDARINDVGSWVALTAEQHYLWQRASGLRSTADRFNEAGIAGLASLIDRGMPEPVALPATGRVVYVTQHRRDALTVLDTTSLQQLAVFKAGKQPIAMGLAHDQRRLFIAGSAGSLSVFDTSQRRALRQINLGFTPISLLVDD